jgi:hypothetical protein
VRQHEWPVNLSNGGSSQFGAIKALFTLYSSGEGW